MIRWIPGAAPSIVGNASTSAVRALAPAPRRDAPAIALHRAELRRDRARVAAVLDEDDERLHARRARCLRPRASCRPAIASPVPGRSFSLRLARVQLEAVGDEHARRRRAPAVATGHGRRITKRAQRPQAPSSGWPRSTKPLRQQPDAVDPGAEHGEHRRQERDRGEHRDRRDQHAADPDRADERQRQHEHREQADRDGRAGDDHRAARVGHRLDERASRRPRPRAARRGSGRSSAARSRSRRRGRRARSGTGR